MSITSAFFSKYQTVIFLMGPTATGKTTLAISLGEYLPIEIISVDSAMVYRQMNIGTAKPSVSDLAKIPHHLIDICDPSEIYSAGAFVKDASLLIDKIQKRGHIPVLVGGTGLYFRRLQQGIASLPAADFDIRATINEEAKNIGWFAMHQRLQSVDPRAAARIHPNDPQRIQRALEIYHICGQTMSDLIDKQKTKALPFQIIKIILAPEIRSDLRIKIANRFTNMLAMGLIYEVEELLDKWNLSEQLPSMRLVGYRQVRQYLVGQFSYQMMKERGIIATNQLAKRQLTWCRQESHAHWINSDDPSGLKKVLAKFSKIGL